MRTPVGASSWTLRSRKFLTRDNDYFFRPTVALIYALFVAVFLLVRHLARRRSPSRAERLAYAYAALTDLALGRMGNRRRRRAPALLVDDDDLTDGLRALLSRAPPPTRPPSRWALPGRATEAIAGRLQAIAANLRVRLAVNLLVLVALRTELAVETGRGDREP